jgi:hypothetical protein
MSDHIIDKFWRAATTFIVTCSVFERLWLACGIRERLPVQFMRKGCGCGVRCFLHV